VIQQYFTLAVDDADVFQTAGSQLRRGPGDGEYRYWIGSDQADGQFSVNVGGMLVVEPSEMPVITVGVLRVDGPPHYKHRVSRGVDVVANYNEVTGGTASLLVQYWDPVDLMLEAGKGPAEIAAQLRGGFGR